MPIPGQPSFFGDIAFAGNVVAVGGPLGSPDEITLFDVRSGDQLGVVQVGEDVVNVSVVGADTRWVVFRIGTTISALDILTHRVVRLVRVAPHTLSISVSGRLVAWTENIGDRGRIRTVELPS